MKAEPQLDLHPILDYNAKDYSDSRKTDAEIQLLRFNDELLFTITPAVNRIPV